ncbi:MAG: Gfo/Idh/MocA family oxidoreductase [Ignavibacteriales bacterium]|nr:Gfo/Idh/MocA family oxidoreductase [Ignavibacteriales bacterium]
MNKNFAITGVAGYVAPRHLRAIRDTGNHLVAATDPRDSVGLLDHYSFDVRFFPEFERFDRHLEKLRRGPEDYRVHYLSVCSPNYLHDAHIRLALRTGADAICEKPLVINPWNLDVLQELERETGKRVFTILQLRLHPLLIELKQQLSKDTSGHRHKVVLTYVSARGPWYDTSWKGIEERSGGLATNIGIHFFDLLLWLFGASQGFEVHVNERNRMAGSLELRNADVSWFLSVTSTDLPFVAVPGAKSTYRSMLIDGKEIEFTEGFGDLHTRVYEQTLRGQGFGIDEARASIELAYAIRHSPVEVMGNNTHPYFLKGTPKESA